MINEDVIMAHALENALVHKGKAVQGAVLNALFAEGLRKEGIQDILPDIEKVLDKVNSMSLEKQKEEFEKLKDIIQKRDEREGLADLEDAEEGKVVMRLAPFPSGPLHIGNARPYIINDEYVKKYKGKLILVMDDTISGETKPVEPDAYKLIPEGFDWLGIKYDKKIVYKSDRLDKYYSYAEELIKKGYMYVCSCSQEEFKKMRDEKIDCGCRHLPREDHLERWKKMFKAKPGEFTVRLKTSMQDSNPAFRDRVMFRITDRNHPKVKKKYRVWPLLEFSWAIDDYLLGITHIIRGIDLQMETRVEKFIWDIFKWKHPVIIHTGFFKIEGVKISKSKGAKEVKSGEYIGWNDPRLWSLQSLRDRGIKPEAIREFILGMGLTKANSTVAIGILYALNKKFLEDVPRYFFVASPVKIHVQGSPELEVKLPLHPSQNLGNRKYKTKQDFFVAQQDFDLMNKENYRLMHLLNFKSDNSPTKAKDFHFISEDPNPELKVKFIQWLPAGEKNFKTRIRMEDNSIVEGLAEPEIRKLKEGDSIQFERFGFVKLYKIDVGKREAEFWFSHR